jgi:hypothetical protein
MTHPRRSFVSLASLALAALLLSAGRCYDKDDFSPTAPETLDALVLSTAGGATTLPADGVSRLRIVAQISPDASPDRRTVLFSTTAGTLIGTAANGMVAVPADGTGRATIELQSAQQVGESVVSAGIQGVAGLTRQLVIGFVPANLDEVIRFTAAPTSAPADDASISSFTVRLSPALPVGTQVMFMTTAGTFQPGGASTVTLTADASATVTADLKSPATLGPGRVTATALSVSREAVIEFRRALPNRITVSTNGTFTVPPSSSAGVTVIGTFLRDIGKVSQGTVATFRATRESGGSVGFFRDITTVGADGTATATFIPGETTQGGRVTLTVGAEGTAVTGTTTIEIVVSGG